MPEYVRSVAKIPNPGDLPITGPDPEWRDAPSGGGGGIHGSGAPTPTVDAEWGLYFDDTVDGGTYTLVWNGQETAPIPWDATLAEVLAAFVALPNVGAGNAVLDPEEVGDSGETVGDYGSVDIMFAGSLAASPQATPTVGSDNLTGGGTVQMYEDQVGSAGDPIAPTGTIYVDDDSGRYYINIGTEDAPAWYGGLRPGTRSNTPLIYQQNILAGGPADTDGQKGGPAMLTLRPLGNVGQGGDGVLQGGTGRTARAGGNAWLVGGFGYRFATVPARVIAHGGTDTPGQHGKVEFMSAGALGLLGQALLAEGGAGAVWTSIISTLGFSPIGGGFLTPLVWVDGVDAATDGVYGWTGSDYAKLTQKGLIGDPNITIQAEQGMAAGGFVLIAGGSGDGGASNPGSIALYGGEQTDEGGSAELSGGPGLAAKAGGHLFIRAGRGNNGAVEPGEILIYGGGPSAFYPGTVKIKVQGTFGEDVPGRVFVASDDANGSAWQLVTSVVHASPVGGGYKTPMVFDDTGVTGGLYGWTGADYVKVGNAV